MNRCRLLVMIASLGIPAMNIAQPAAPAASTDDARFAIIPQPANVQAQPGSFDITPQTQIHVAADNPEFKHVAELLAQYVKTASGIELAIATEETTNAAGSQIFIKALEPSDTSPEAYTLKITPEALTLSAADPRGAFYGVQTLRQMLQVKNAHKSRLRVWYVPCAEIIDAPRYGWRGMLLDCGRHFMDKDFIKRYIDLLAYHKLNVLHWHLTEDQGWRIEIKKYPKLTEIGAWRDQEGERYGGFYTQEDIKEIVAYAASRYITVVPEIEMPGHSLAALAAYPQLSCTGGPFEVGNKWGIFEDVYCAGNDETFQFLTDVLDEVIALFPSPYIHIGGDECPKKRWQACEKCQARIKAEGLKDERELQSYFIKRIEKYVNSKGKRIIGWDEILEGGLAPNATVQSWRGMSGAIAAATSGHDVIASPVEYCYIDYAQARLPSEHSFGFLPLQRCYSFEPTPSELTPEQAKHILGIECNIWTERAPMQRVDRQVFPRLCALSEVAWSPRAVRDYENFSQRMLTHYRRLEELGVKFFFRPPTMQPHHTIFQRSLTFNLVSPIGLGEIRYTLDGSAPTKESDLFRDPITVTQNATLRARTFLKDGRESDVAVFHLRKLKPQPAMPDPQEISHGLDCLYYEGDFWSAPDFSTLTPNDKTVVNEISLAPRKRDTMYALQFLGKVHLLNPGRYTFYVRADDGCRVRIDGQTIIDENRVGGTDECFEEMMLAAGWRYLQVDYFQARGYANLELEIEGPGLKRQPIPQEWLGH